MINGCKPVAVGIGMLFLVSPHAGQAACETARFSAPPRRDFAAGSHPTSVAVGDFNGDGTPDLAVANGDSTTVSILLGTGTGSFGAASNFTAGTSPASVAVADFNGDGTPDLAVANAGSRNVSILLGTGIGTFGEASNFLAGTSPTSVAVGDFNGDGTADLVVATSGSPTVSVLLGTGTGSFGRVSAFAAGQNPSRWRSATSTVTAPRTWPWQTSTPHTCRSCSGRARAASGHPLSSPLG